MVQRALILWIAVAAVAGATRAQHGSLAPIEAPLQAELPALAEQSGWGVDPGAADAAPRPVLLLGNGHVFARCGDGLRTNGLMGITGPGYGGGPAWSPDGDWGELACTVLRQGADWTAGPGRVRRVRGAGILVTEEGDGQGLVLRTLTVALPGRAEIVRVLQLVNRGGATARDLRLTARWPGARPGDGALAGALTRSLAAAAQQAERRGVLSMSDAVPADDGVLRSGEAFDLPVGGTAAATLRLLLTATALPIAEADLLPPTPAAALATVRDTLAWWRQELADTVQFAGEPRRLVDLLEDWKVALIALQDAQSGAVLPMLHHRRAVLRDLGGALLGCLRLGLWDRARAVLRFEFAAAARSGRIAASWPLDDPATAPDRPLAGWDGLEVPGGDLASWIVLHHYWYLRATRDAATIRRHWPLLEACVKRAPRRHDVLLPLHGTEPWTHGGLYRLHPEVVGNDSRWPADAPQDGRRAWSFASGLLFVQAVAALGGMQDQLDRVEQPGRWRNGAPEPRPGAAWTRRAIELVQALEQHYWVEDAAWFAPALSPLTGEPHPAPQAEIGLLPVWTGMLLATGDRATRHLRGTLASLWHDGGRLGSSPTVAAATPLAQAAAIVALSHFEGAERGAAWQAMLDLADPSGSWQRVHGPAVPAGTPDAAVGLRWGPWEGGIAVDALLYGLTGLRIAAAPGIDEEWLRLRPALPPGSSSCAIRGMRHDGIGFDLHLDEVIGPLDADEREVNEQLPAERRRDPESSHRRLRFALLPTRLPPGSDHGFAVVHSMGTQFQEYLRAGEPMVRTEYWTAGDAMLASRAGPPPGPHAVLPPPDGTTWIVLSCRDLAASVYRGEGMALLDTGLPHLERRLAAWLEAAPAARVLADWGWDRTGTVTFATPDAMARVARMLASATAADREVVRPGFVEPFEQRASEVWRPTAAEAGCLSVSGPGPMMLRTQLPAQSVTTVLRLGCDAPVRLLIDGHEKLHVPQPVWPLEPDQHAVALPPHAAPLTLELELAGSGRRSLFVRVTDACGRPPQ